MRLNIEHVQIIEEPDDKAIEDALRSLRGNYGEEPGFAILDPERTEGDGNFFMQTAGGPDTFVVEYRDGIKKRQYRSKNEKLRLQTVIALFQAYRRDDEYWKRSVSWKDIITGRTSTTGGEKPSTRFILYVLFWTVVEIIAFVTMGLAVGLIVVFVFLVLMFFLRDFLGLPRQ